MAVAKHVIATEEWCAPTAVLPNQQLVTLVHKSRSRILTEGLRLDIEVTRDAEVAMLVNKKPEDAAVSGAKIDSLPEAALLAPLATESVADHPVREAPTTLYPMHRDTLRPVRIMLLLLAIATCAAVPALLL